MRRTQPVEKIAGLLSPVRRRPDASMEFDPRAEFVRLEQARTREGNWKRWGPYLPERQWGTVREDYSADGNPWTYFPHDHARSRTYRWGEDGLLGWTDRECRFCFSVALWNGNDPILKERLFGLTGPEGNHGEDVKERYWYLDSSPSHSYCRGVYRYPQREFPYGALVAQNQTRSRTEPEYELEDAGLFDSDRFFDVQIEYAKAGPDDVLIRIRATNRGPAPATLHLLPTFWFRNTWVWGCKYDDCVLRPDMRLARNRSVTFSHATLGEFVVAIDDPKKEWAWLFTDNETNERRLYGKTDGPPFVKDAFHRWLIDGEEAAINEKRYGTKTAAWKEFDLAPGREAVVRLRYRPQADDDGDRFGPAFDEIFDTRIAEMNAFYDAVLPEHLRDDERVLARQAAGGLLWTKQFYHYVVDEWLEGDPAMPVPPPGRRRIRNSDWAHLFNRDVISMPDKWEYPWYAAWDLAFHMLPLSKLDPDFAKRNIEIFLREWYMHPNGQIPAYEFNLSDVNPPVHAWAALDVFLSERECGREDYSFLAGAFQKLLMNFTWWVNRKDEFGENLFSGGFLGLDNIGVFDRSKPLPTGGTLEQADGTAWMGFYCVIMLRIAFRLALVQKEYADTASKFFEHFIHIADALNHLGGTGLWDERDGFYYDRMRVGDQSTILRVRSIAGLMPLCSAMILSQETVDALPGFRKRMEWFLKYRQDLSRDMSYLETERDTDPPGARLLALPSKERLRRALAYVFDENEFLSPYGIRSLSKIHAEQPYVFHVDGAQYRVDYEPAESRTGMFGGNSNWRGPIWFPLNYLLIESLRTYDAFYQEKFEIEYPTGSGEERCLKEIADDLEDRLLSLFEADADGQIPYLAGRKPAISASGELMHEFFEYFDAETGKGLGASHQTGWTALVYNILEARSRRREKSRESQREETVAHDIA